MKNFEQWLRNNQGRPSHTNRSKKDSPNRVRKKRNFRCGSMLIPLNDANEYRSAQAAYRFFVVTPSDHTRMQFALEEGLLSKAVFGPYGSIVVEGLLLDEESGIPWLVPKVTIDYKQIAYGASTRQRAQQDLETAESAECPEDAGLVSDVAAEAGQAIIKAGEGQKRHTC